MQRSFNDGLLFARLPSDELGAATAAAACVVLLLKITSEYLLFVCFNYAFVAWTKVTGDDELLCARIRSTNKPTKPSSSMFATCALFPIFQLVPRKHLSRAPRSLLSLKLISPLSFLFTLHRLGPLYSSSLQVALYFSPQFSSSMHARIFLEIIPITYSLTKKRMNK